MVCFLFSIVTYKKNQNNNIFNKSKVIKNVNFLFIVEICLQFAFVCFIDILQQKKNIIIVVVLIGFILHFISYHVDIKVSGAIYTLFQYSFFYLFACILKKDSTKRFFEEKKYELDVTRSNFL